MKIIQGDSIKIMAAMPENSIDTIITDPPYGIAFLGSFWDRFKNAKELQRWTELWAIEALRVAKPGAIMLVFGGTRTSHRVACGIEDAGWTIRDTMMWLYASGFPKSLDLGKAMDKIAGVEPEVLADNPNDRQCRENALADYGLWRVGKSKITSPITKEAKLWDGYKTQLKPAWEPILVCMKPLEGSFAENALKYGVAGFNIDECRIATTEDLSVERPGDELLDTTNQGWNFKNVTRGNEGRYPANLILSHHPDCKSIGVRKVRCSRGGYERKAQSLFLEEECGMENLGYGDEDGMELVEDWQCVEECPVKMLDEAAGIFKYANSGSASRFFYTGKASPFERDRGCEGLYWLDRDEIDKGTYDLLSAENQKNKNNRDFKRHGIQRGNIHPTVKPLAVIEYLCKLTRTPTGGFVLDPFAGSMTTALACIRTGRDWIMIERLEKYCKIGKKRIQAFERQQVLF